MIKKCDNFFEAEIEHSEDDEDDKKSSSEAPIVLINQTESNSQIAAAHDNEESSKSINLNNQQFRDIEEEALCDGWSEPSNMNRLVSDILKTRKIDPSDIASKKRRQRLSFEQ